MLGITKLTLTVPINQINIKLTITFHSAVHESLSLND